MAAAIPIVQETVRQCILILNSKQQNETKIAQDAATPAPGSSTLTEIITSSGISPVELPTLTPAILNPGISNTFLTHTYVNTVKNDIQDYSAQKALQLVKCHPV